jgi:hypothetical protein
VAQLRRLAPDPGDELTEKFTVEWGQVVAGDTQPLPPSGARLHCGTPIYLRFHNESDRDLYFFAFDLGVAAAVTLLTAADPSGLRVPPSQEYLFGARDGVLRGSVLTWPVGVPAADPRPETVLIIVTSAPQDLGVLTIGGAGASRGAWSLQRALTGVVGRGAPPVIGPPARYAVVRLDWQLTGGSAPVG